MKRRKQSRISLCWTVAWLSVTASLRAELNHLHASSIEHLKQIHLKENSAAKRELESAMEHSHKQVTHPNRAFSAFWRRALVDHQDRLAFRVCRNKSCWLGSRICKRRCVPVTTASPTWITRSTLWMRPSTLWPESWSTRVKKCCGSAVKLTSRYGTEHDSSEVGLWSKWLKALFFLFFQTVTVFDSG